MLTYHIPEKAQTHFTTGMKLENTSEAICPFWNKWTRVYASIQDKEVQLSLAARQQWLHSSPNLPDLRKTKKRKFSRCGEDSHYKRKCGKPENWVPLTWR